MEWQREYFWLCQLTITMVAYCNSIWRSPVCVYTHLGWWPIVDGGFKLISPPFISSRDKWSIHSPRRQRCTQDILFLFSEKSSTVKRAAKRHVFLKSCLENLVLGFASCSLISLTSQGQLTCCQYSTKSPDAQCDAFMKISVSARRST